VHDPDEAFRTTPIPWIFEPVEVAEKGNSRLVAPTDLKANPLLDWLVRLATLEVALAPAC
jgi:hypothetical protein